MADDSGLLPDFQSFFDTGGAPPPSTGGYTPTPADTSSLSAGLSTDFYNPPVSFVAPAVPAPSDTSAAPSGGFFDRLGGQLSSYFSNPSNLLKAGVGLGGLGLGLYESSQAGAQGAAAQRQIAGIPENIMKLSQATQQELNNISQQYQAMVNQASSALQGMSQPMMQEFSQLLTLTNQGKLTPANKQILDAARARLAQDAANRGSVGAEQSQTQIDDLTQRLLASQMQQALQLFQTASPGIVSGIETGLTGTQQATGYRISGLEQALSAAGLQDQYLMAAIQEGLRNDQVAREQLGQFTGAIGEIVGGSPSSGAR